MLNLTLVSIYSLVQKWHIPSYRALLNNAFVGVIVLVMGQGLLIWSEQFIASGYLFF